MCGRGLWPSWGVSVLSSRHRSVAITLKGGGGWGRDKRAYGGTRSLNWPPVCVLCRSFGRDICVHVPPGSA